MRVVHYIHRLNMTEAGLSGTKALFLRISSNAIDDVVRLWGISYLDLDKNYPLHFIDTFSHKIYTLVLRKFSKNSKELRINSIAKFLSDNNVETGDEITLTCISKEDGSNKYYIAVKKNVCTQFCHVKSKKAYVILHKELLPPDSEERGLQVVYNGREKRLTFSFLEKNTLRNAVSEIEKDSTAKALSLDIYKVLIDNEPPTKNLSLCFSNGKYVILEEKKWEFCEINS